MVHRQQAHADPAEAVLAAAEQVGNEPGVLDLGADHAAVLVVEGDVEHRPELGLERHGQRRIATARSLGITRECLYKKLRRYGMQ